MALWVVPATGHREALQNGKKRLLVESPRVGAVFCWEPEQQKHGFYRLVLYISHTPFEINNEKLFYQTNCKTALAPPEKLRSHSENPAKEEP